MKKRDNKKIYSYGNFNSYTLKKITKLSFEIISYSIGVLIMKEVGSWV